MDRTRFEPVALFSQENVFVTRLREIGVEVVVFEDVLRHEREANSKLGRLGRMVALGRNVVRRKNELRRLKIDLLHLNNSPSVGSDDWLPAARLVGIPCVVTVMGGLSKPSTWVHRWLYRRFDVYLAISRYMAGILRHNGVNPRRIELVYLGVDFDKLRSRVTRTRDDVRAELGIRNDQLMVLMVGNIREWKGQREVVAALRLLPDYIRSRLRVCFAGGTAAVDREYESFLHEDIDANDLTECVTFLGSRSDVPDLYAAADIALHASTSPEPFGLVVPEAMALNCAVIAAASGGPAEVITPGTGFLCDPSEPTEYARALELLVENSAVRGSVAAAGPARASLFSIERTVEGTQRAYARALRKKRR